VRSLYSLALRGPTKVGQNHKGNEGGKRLLPYKENNNARQAERAPQQGSKDESEMRQQIKS